MRAPRTLLLATLALIGTSLAAPATAGADGSTVAGVVRDRSGAGVADVVVTTTSGSPSVRRTTRTDATGAYVVGADAGPTVVCFAPAERSDLNDECWRDARPEGSDRPTRVEVVADTPTTGIDPVLDPASHLRGRLVDAAGAPAAGVVLTTARVSEDSDNLVFPADPAGQTDAEGRFDVRLPAWGRYRLCASDTDRRRYLDACFFDDRSVSVPEGTSVDGLHLELADRSTISGRVTSGDGGSVAGTRVELAGTTYATTVDRDGDWSILGPAKGTYRLRVVARPGRYRSQDRDVEVARDGEDVTGLATELSLAPPLRAARPRVTGRFAPGTSAVLHLGRWDGPVTHRSIRWYVGRSVATAGDDRTRLYLRPWMINQRITVVVRVSTDRAERSAGMVSSRPSVPVRRR